MVHILPGVTFDHPAVTLDRLRGHIGPRRATLDSRSGHIGPDASGGPTQPGGFTGTRRAHEKRRREEEERKNGGEEEGEGCVLPFFFETYRLLRPRLKFYTQHALHSDG